MIAEAHDSSLEKALIRKVQGFFHHSGGTAAAKAAVEQIQGLSRNGNGPFTSLKSSKAPTNYFTPNILRKSWSRLVVSVVHLDALAFPVAAM
ncbi:MAG: hypothetical protein MR929_06575 [Sutterella wadsworthensis]|nr:hypothetical protein [Sutterella wadsworthensis]